MTLNGSQLRIFTALVAAGLLTLSDEPAFAEAVQTAYSEE